MTNVDTFFGADIQNIYRTEQLSFKSQIKSWSNSRHTVYFASMFVIWSPLNQMITIQVENSSETEIRL